MKFRKKSNQILNLKSLRVYILTGVCGCLAITSIFLTIESATSGAEVSNLQKKETELLTQQQDLQNSLVESLSINSLQEKSAEMGFSKANNLVYVSGGISVARLSEAEASR